MRGKYLSAYGECAFGEYAESIYSKSIWRIWQFGVICGTQSCLRMRGKYLNAFREYTERMYVYMEKMQRDSWGILLIRQEI